MEKNHKINTKILVISVVITGIILILLVGFYFYSKESCDVVPVPLDEKETVTTELIKEDTKYYSIDAMYPVITLDNKETQDKINQEIESIIDSEISFFKDAHEEMGDTGMEWMVSTLDISYDTYLLTDQKISILFIKDRYISGAAHPIMGYDVLNYDLKNNKLLDLGDLYKDYSDYLNIISEYCEQELINKLGDEALDIEGVSADEANFQKFIIQEESVVILFEPYQVAAYAVGPQQVEVPLDLDSIKFADEQERDDIIGSGKTDIQSFEDCVEAGFPIMESYPRQCATPDGQTFTENIGNEFEKTDLIMIDNPRPNQTISSPLTISGQARGTWFFEATFPIELYNEAGDLIVSSYATSKGEWMTEEFVPFEATIEFTETIGKGTLILKKDNPSDLPEYDDQLVIPISFE